MSRDALQTATNAGQPSVVAEIALALVAQGDEGDPPGMHRLTAGTALLQFGRLFAAQPVLEAAAKMLPLGMAERARAWANLAVSAVRSGSFATAEYAANQVLQEFAGRHETDFAQHIASAHHALGYCRELAKDFAGAEQQYAMAAECYTDPWRQSGAICDRALVLAQLSPTHLQQADALMSGLDPNVLAHFPPGQFAKSSTLAVIRHVGGDHHAALNFGEAALGLRIPANEANEAPLLTWLCKAAVAVGDTERAWRYMEQARSIMMSSHSGVWDELNRLEGVLRNA